MLQSIMKVNQVWWDLHPSIHASRSSAIQHLYPPPLPITIPSLFPFIQIPSCLPRKPSH